MNVEETLEELNNTQFSQLGQKDFKEIYEQKKELENMQFDSTGLKGKEYQLIKLALEICERLLKEAVVYKVVCRIGKTRDGNFSNGGTSYFWTHEEAQDFISGFKEKESGWTSEIDEPEEIPLDEAEMD